MAKTLLAFSIAFFGAMTVFAAAVEACISCEYVPEVVNSPSKSYDAKRYKKERVNRAAKKRKAHPIVINFSDRNMACSPKTAPC